jgi:hypothetical protein
MHGVCALCGQAAALIDSHFLPAALYQEMNDPTGPIKSMVVVTPDGTFQSGAQFHMHLLCMECEIRFQQGGEAWTLRMRYRSDETFPLRDLLLKSSPSNSNAETRIYEATTVADLEIDQLVYFAASILWRAGITDWATKFANAPKIDLSAPLMSKLAAYLQGTDSFPSDVFLVVSLAPEAQPIRTLLVPVKVQDTPFTKYEAHIPGMMFEWFIGAASALDTWSLNNPPRRIVLTDLIRQRLLKVAAKNIPASEPKGSLKKQFS